MLDKIYYVYGAEDFWDHENVEIAEIFFTNKEVAELYAEYCDLGDKYTNYKVIELSCGDNMADDLHIFINNLKEEKRMKEEVEKHENKCRELHNYAVSKSKIEGGDWFEIYNELLKERGLDQWKAL